MFQDLQFTILLKEKHGNMYKTAKHSGKIGDIIYSLPTIKALNIEVLYIPKNTTESNGLYDNIKDLLLMQPYIKEVRPYTSNLPYCVLDEKKPVDYDLDRARLQPMKGVIHIVKRYMDAFGVNYPNWKEPWLVLDQLPSQRPWWSAPEDYTLINHTGRHITNDQLKITSRIDWHKIVCSIPGPKYFVGTTKEHSDFCKRYDVSLHYIETVSILHLAVLIQKAKAIYCNQSSVLSICQGLGKTYYLEPKPMKQNCLLRTPNENILQ